MLPHLVQKVSDCRPVCSPALQARTISSTGKRNQLFPCLRSYGVVVAEMARQVPCYQEDLDAGATTFQVPPPSPISLSSSVLKRQFCHLPHMRTKSSIKLQRIRSGRDAHRYSPKHHPCHPFQNIKCAFLTTHDKDLQASTAGAYPWYHPRKRSFTSAADLPSGDCWAAAHAAGRGSVAGSLGQTLLQSGPGVAPRVPGDHRLLGGGGTDVPGHRRPPLTPLPTAPCWPPPTCGSRLPPPSLKTKEPRATLPVLLRCGE